MEETRQENGTFDVEITLLQNNSDNLLSLLAVDDVITVPDYIYVYVNLVEINGVSGADVYVQVRRSFYQSCPNPVLRAAYGPSLENSAAPEFFQDEL